MVRRTHRKMERIQRNKEKEMIKRRKWENTKILIIKVKERKKVPVLQMGQLRPIVNVIKLFLCHRLWDKIR